MDTEKYEGMELDELKEYAKSIGVQFGRIGKEKLIEKIVQKESEKLVNEVIMDSDVDDFDEPGTEVKAPQAIEEEIHSDESILEDIVSAIDELDDSETEEVELVEELPLDMRIPVKSITYGTLIYKSRTNNVVFKWNKIGAVEYMTIADLNEMNNYKESFLRTPRVILMDERAIKQFRLTSVYEKVSKINNLSSVFKTEDMRKIEQTIDIALDANMRDILISKVRQMYKNKKLTNINIIRMLEQKLQFDLSDSE